MFAKIVTDVWIATLNMNLFLSQSLIVAPSKPTHPSSSLPII